MQTGTRFPLQRGRGPRIWGGLGDDDRAVWATPHGIPLNSLARVSWHTHKIRGRASIQFHRIPSSERSRPSHFITSTTPSPADPPGPLRNIPSLSRRGAGPPQFSCRCFTDQSRASNGPGSGGQWLPASLMAVSACHRRHRPETSPSPNGPWATKDRERAKKTSAPRSRFSSVNRSVCWSAGMQLHWIPHFQRTLPALNSVSAV